MVFLLRIYFYPDFHEIRAKSRKEEHDDVALFS